MNELENNVAIVTGASHSKGIGCAVARKLAAAGASVLITDLEQNQQQLAEVANDISATGAVALPLSVDVTSQENVTHCVDQAMERFGHIDILVNNAGVGGGSGEFLELRNEDFELAYRVNVMGLVNMCRAAIPPMLESGAGVIVNVASLCGLGAIPDIPHSYTASKFAAVGLTKAIALEYADQGIRCNAVCPGVVNTDMRDQLMQQMSEQYGITPKEAERLENETIAMQRGAEAAEIADAVAYLAGPASGYVTGIVLPVAGGLGPGL